METLKEVYLLEVWREGVHENILHETLGVFTDKKILNRYKLLNPLRSHLNLYFKERTIDVLDNFKTE